MLDIINLSQMTTKSTIFHLAKPNKTIVSNIGDVASANIGGYGLNKISTISLEIPSKVMNNNQYIDNPIIKQLKKKMLIRVKWNDRKNINWFIINDIEKVDSSDSIIKIEGLGLPSELGNIKTDLKLTSVNPTNYFNEILKYTSWKLANVDVELNTKYRSFDESSKTILELLNDGLEAYGAIAIYNDENRTVSIKNLSNVREYRGVVLKRENFADSIISKDSSDDIVTRLYVYGSEKLGIEKVNPTGMGYIENFDAFLQPFKRDANKNVLEESQYMSNELAHAILDLREQQAILLPEIKNLQSMINEGYDGLVIKETQLSNSQSEVIKAQALLDTAKAASQTDIIPTRETELQVAKDITAQLEIDIENIKDSIAEWENQIYQRQLLISTTSFTNELQNELKSFIYVREFSDDRYIDEKELYEEGLRQFAKYQNGTKTFEVSAEQFLNSVESWRYKDRIKLGEEVRIHSSLYDEDYSSMIIGYPNIDLITGDIRLEFSDNIDDVNALDKLAAMIYKGNSASSMLSDNKHKWDGVTKITNEVREMRTSAMETVKNKILAGADESIVIDNKGILVTSPTHPDHMLIIQSGVMALSKDGGDTWETAITPDGVYAEALIGRLIAGEKLVITNESGSFVMDENGLSINSDSINIWSGSGDNKEDMLSYWNTLLSNYEDYLSDNQLNSYEKTKLKNDNETIKSIFSSMVNVFHNNYVDDEGLPLPQPIEYKNFVTKYNALQTYLTTTKQSDGYAILDESNMGNSTVIIPSELQTAFKDYENAKATFEAIIPMKFSKSGIEILKDSIALQYVENGEIVSKINASAEGIKIDARLFEINAETQFNDNLIMNAGVIKSKDGGITIDLNAGVINLSKPITINARPVATTDDVDEKINEIELTPGPKGDNSYTHIAYADINSLENHIDFVGKTNEWISGYFDFMNRNIKNIGGALTVNNMGLVGGKFALDDNKYSYNPPSISTSEAQSLTIRGLLRAYKSENKEEYLTMAKWLMDAYLKYYFPTEIIPTTPNPNWVPHWMVNVNEPFRGREWFTEGKATFVKGVATFTMPEVIHVYTVRDLDAKMRYEWTPAGDIIGGSYEIEMLNHDPSGNAIKITLKDKTVNGEKLLSYSTATGKMVNIGDKCESYPVWRPLEEGEIGCAVDTVPWTMDAFKLMYEITKDEKWNNAYKSMKAAIVEISDVDNIEYFIKFGGKDTKVLANGITSYSIREPKEVYQNTGKEILITYPKNTEAKESSIGTWVGDRKPFSDEKWIELKIGSSTRQVVGLYIDEDEKYDASKRWKTDIWLRGNGIANKEVIKVKLSDFYKKGGVVWGAHYGETSNGGVTASGNSSITKTEILENSKMISSINFVRGDEGGWLGWAQYMLSIWEYTLPFEIKYKTDNNFNVLINDSQDVQWKYPLPKTNGEFKTVKLTEEMFTGGTTIAKGNYKSIAIEAVDETSNIQIEYVGRKESYNKEYFSTISFAYEQPQALQVGIEYIKPAPSKEPLPYVPYVLPFDFHLINYQSTDLRGALYTGYQMPWIYQEDIFEDSVLALQTNLEFLSDSQDAYYENAKVNGFFAPIFWWNYKEDYGSNTPNTFGMTGNWGDVWGGFQYRTFSYVARILDKEPDNELSYKISMRFIKGVKGLWTEKLNFPTNFSGSNKPNNDQVDIQMVANYLKGLIRTLNSTRITPGDEYIISGQIAKSLEYFDYWHVTESPNDIMNGTWSPNIPDKEWYNYWGGEILDAFAIFNEKQFKDVSFSFNSFPEANAIGFYSDNKPAHSLDYRDYQWSSLTLGIDIGGNNLLLKSNNSYVNSSHLIAKYTLSETPMVGAKYTCTIYGRLGKGKRCFSIYNGDSVFLADLKKIENGKYSSTFTWENDYNGYVVDTPTELYVYTEDSSVNSTSTIDKIKLEKGRIITDWSLSIKDVENTLDTKADANTVDENFKDISEALNDKVSTQALEDLKEAYRKYKEESDENKRQVAENIKTLLEREKYITYTLGEMSISWEALTKQMIFGEEGLTIGSKITGNYVLVDANQIAFYSNGKITALMKDGDFEFVNGVITNSFRTLNLQMTQGNQLNHVSFRLV